MSTKAMERAGDRVIRMPGLLALALALVFGTAACGSGPTEPEVLTLFVLTEEVDCVGEAERTCLQVRESPDEAWRLFYDVIEGFEYDPGFVYELRVERHRVENPPADASGFRYILLEVVSVAHA